MNGEAIYDTHLTNTYLKQPDFCMFQTLLLAIMENTLGSIKCCIRSGSEVIKLFR